MKESCNDNDLFSTEEGMGDIWAIFNNSAENEKDDELNKASDTDNRDIEDETVDKAAADTDDFDFFNEDATKVLYKDFISDTPDYNEEADTEEYLIDTIEGDYTMVSASEYMEDIESQENEETKQALKSIERNRQNSPTDELKNLTKVTINDIELVIQEAKDKVESMCEKKRFKKVRIVKSYNKAKKEKIKYAEAKTKKENGKELLIFFIIFAFVCGIIIGVKANSYYNHNIGSEVVTCIITGLLNDDLETTLLPLYTNIFIPSFIGTFVLISFIGLIVWSSNEEKKKSRLGHEHGNSSLMTDNQIRKYKKKFME